ncbi:MAG: 3-hydroxylacyl-ACP dehydratase [Treponema sp.]|jgi:predicted hotdog family 3-hydroxylacyl-ACP dehydratase|nr:3-hydroxylacyl-ACP dehydratase [Treponema sp.]
MNGGIIEKDELASLVPHKGKMFMLSRLLEYSIEERTLTAEYDVSGDCLFYDEELDGLPAWAAFELMAQSICVLSGLRGREKGQGPKPGFILSVTGMEIMTPVLQAGSPVRINIKEDCRVDEVFTFDCRVFCGAHREADEVLLYDEEGVLAARARLTVMDADAEFLEKLK